MTAIAPISYQLEASFTQQYGRDGIKFFNDVYFACQWLWASGSTVQRPPNPYLGQMFYDTTLGGAPIYCDNAGAPTKGVPPHWSQFGSGGGGGVTEVDGGHHISTVNPTGPIVTVNLDFFTQDQIPFGKLGGGDLAQSSNLVWKNSANELIVNGTIFIPNDTNPGVTAEMVGNAGLVEAKETVIGGSSTIQAVDNLRDTIAVLAATGSTTYPSAGLSLVADDQTSNKSARVDISAGMVGGGAGTGQCLLDLSVDQADYISQLILEKIGGVWTTRFTHGGTLGSFNEQPVWFWSDNPTWNYDQGPLTNGGTYTIANKKRYVILGAFGTIASFTVKFPPSPNDGEVHTVMVTQAVTTFTLDGNGNTVFFAPTTLVAGQTFAYIFISGVGWYPVSSGVGGGSGGGAVSITGTSPIAVSPSPITGTGVVSHVASGVSAGSYGDAGHVSQITVDADGHVTAASSVSISGSGSLVLLESLTFTGVVNCDVLNTFTTSNVALYDQFQIDIVDLVPSSSGLDFQMLYSADGGVTFDTVTTHYNFSYVHNSEAAAGSRIASALVALMPSVKTPVGTVTAIPYAQLWCFRPNNSGPCIIHSFCAWTQSSDSHTYYDHGMCYNNDAAHQPMNALRFRMSAAITMSCRIKTYGVKK